MRVSNHPLSKIKAKLRALLPLSTIEELSVSSGFLVRAARKITALDFVLSFFMCCATRKATLSNWVSQLCILNGSTQKQNIPSRQAICKRLTEASSTFAEALLTRLLSSRINTVIQKVTSRRHTKGGILSAFSSVLLQDSTTVSLPDTLSSFFKGSVSCGLTKAIARIQCIMDIRTMRFVHFNLGSFCDNDQGAASMIHHLVTKGTLVIRDLGYFALSSLKEIAAREGYFLSRLKYGLCLYSTDKGRELSLTSLLRSSAPVRSIEVIVGKDYSLPMRLLIIRLSPQLAAERRRKAKADRDKRLNHSKEYMLTLGYQLMLTNVGEDIWTPEQGAEAYRLRWGIECVFKGFKSAGPHMNELCEGVRTNGERVRSTLLLTLCFMVVQVMIIYRLFAVAINASSEERIRTNKGKKAEPLYLSLNRMITWICDNFILWITSPPELQAQYLQLFCCHENRKDRINTAKHLKLALA